MAADPEDVDERWMVVAAYCGLVLIAAALAVCAAVVYYWNF